MNDEPIAKAASLLIAARRARAPLERLPEDCRPATLDEALRIQARPSRNWASASRDGKSAA